MIHGGHAALDFESDVVILIGLIALVMLAPLCVFAPRISHAERQGRGDYGRLAAGHTQAFHRKCVTGGHPADEKRLGSGDIQPLADLDNGHAFVQATRPMSFGLQVVTNVAMIAAVPLAPLVFIILPLESLVSRAVKILT